MRRYRIDAIPLDTPEPLEYPLNSIHGFPCFFKYKRDAQMVAKACKARGYMKVKVTKI